jgi:tetratricopeptide (TPR) repeat protein
MKKILMIVLPLALAAAWYLNISTMAENDSMYKKYIRAAQKYEEMDLLEDAQNMYTAALSIYADDEEITLKLANVSRKLGDTSQFVSLCQSMISGDSLSEEALTELVDYYAQTSKYDTLIDTLKEMRASYPENDTVSGLWQQYEGLFHKTGSSYTTLGQIYNGYTVGTVQDGICLVDADGGSVLGGGYESVGYLSAYNSRISVCKDGEWYYVNLKNHKKMVSDEQYEYCGLYSEGYAVAVKDGKYGYINTYMQPATEFIWDQATNIYHGVGAVCKEGKWALINGSLEQITDYIYSDIAINEMNFCSTNARIFAGDESGYHMLDASGKEVGTGIYEDARAFSSTSYAAVCSGGKWGFVGADGEIFIDFQYDNAKNFGAGYAPVFVDGVWGYINTQNQMVIEPQFEDAYPFCSNGTASVKKGSYYMIKLYAIS